jgi:Protein of unknown function (DUF1579)
MFTTAVASKPQSLQPQISPSTELQLLNIFVGKWHTEGLSYGSGQSKENPHDSPVRWLGAETYEWLPGGFFLVNHFDAKIGNTAISGIETVGYDAVSQSYPSQLFDSHGRILSGQRSIRDGVWSSSIGTEYRTTYAFSNGGNNLATHWEWLDGDDWFVLADLEATKVN